MVTEDIASTSDEALHHHQPSEKEGEKEDAQHSEKETGTEKETARSPYFLWFSRPFYFSLCFRLFFATSFFFCNRTFILDFVSAKLLFDVHFAVLMSWQI